MKIEDLKVGVVYRVNTKTYGNEWLDAIIGAQIVFTGDKDEDGCPKFNLLNGVRWKGTFGISDYDYFYAGKITLENIVIDQCKKSKEI